MPPTRETFGNIPNSSQLIFYCLTVVAMAAFAYGIWRRFKLWRNSLRNWVSCFWPVYRTPDLARRCKTDIFWP
jgi:hypothetical protein